MEGSMRHIGKSIPQKIQATRVFNSGEEFGSLRLLQELKQDSPNLTRKRVIGASRRHAGTQHRVAHRAGAVHQASVKTLDSQAAVIERAGDVFRREVL
jgi:hypothetical protein